MGDAKSPGFLNLPNWLVMEYESHTFPKNGLEMFYQQNHLAWWEGMLPEGRSSYRSRRRAPSRPGRFWKQ